MHQTIPCEHWRDEGLIGAGVCALGRFKGRPSHGVCRACLGLPAMESSEAEHRPTRVFVTKEQQTLAQAHRAICEACPQVKGFTRWTVSCRQCGCAGLSLVRGECPEGKWGDESVNA